jgi:hypothetical protein
MSVGESIGCMMFARGHGPLMQTLSCVSLGHWQLSLEHICIVGLLGWKGG